MSSRPQTPTPAGSEVIDLAQLDEDDEDEVLEEGDFMPAVAEVESTSKRKRDHLLGPSCPICGETLGPTTSNQELNDHVDMCLNKDAIVAASKATPKKPKRVKPPSPVPKSGPGMLQWLRKGQDEDS
jgi:DNA polymerase kappa